ncbi:MAG: SIS domain-containing protein [Azonexus sp.]
MQAFISGYLEKMIESLRQIDQAVVAQIISAFEACYEKKGSIYIIGNGGSAATASHMANDFSCGLKLRGIRDFNVLSLVDNVPVCTAIANDIGYENIFYAQLKDRLKGMDILLAISCSGNSGNILKAVHYARSSGTMVIGLTGFEGGALRDLSDINFHVATDKGEYGIVEDIHMMLDHIIFSYFLSLKPESKTVYSLR